MNFLTTAKLPWVGLVFGDPHRQVQWTCPTKVLQDSTAMEDGTPRPRQDSTESGEIAVTMQLGLQVWSITDKLLV